MDITNEGLKSFSEILRTHCGIKYDLELVEKDKELFVSMANSGGVFGYVPANASSMLAIMNDIIKVALYGGADDNYISEYTFMREYA